MVSDECECGPFDTGLRKKLESGREKEGRNGGKEKGEGGRESGQVKGAFYSEHVPKMLGDGSLTV